MKTLLQMESTVGVYSPLHKPYYKRYDILFRAEHYLYNIKV